MLLYAVTDRHWLQGRSLSAAVEAALKGGVTFLQLREKDLPYENFLAEAWKIKALAARYKVPFVINDNVEVALACDADGVHVGQSDLETGSARQRLGNDKILGVSVQTVEQAVLAEQQGADYLGVGAIYATDTKRDADIVTYETLRRITKAVTIPVVAIGGITEENLLELSGSGIDGVALVSAIFAAPEIQTATARLHELTKRMVNACV